MQKSLKVILFTSNLLIFCLICGRAEAFCGFFASSASATATNNSSEVALMRYGTKTVLSMRNHYKGPAKDFALVIPVPQILKKEDVHTLNHAVFDDLDAATAPKLVEYWEKDPCHKKGKRTPSGYKYDALRSSKGSSAKTTRSPSTTKKSKKSKKPKVEAGFTSGEYTIQILSAEESAGLETWLTSNGYNLPKGASTALASYIAQGMYFFVAKVDPKKVKFDKKGNALLSPLQFSYDSKDFSLPIRLGLLNADGPQDLIIYILSDEFRSYRVSNYPTVAFPTNLLLTKEDAANYNAFHESIFKDFQRRHPKSFAIEHHWKTKKCDPCPPSGALTGKHLSVLGLKTAIAASVEAQEPIVEITHPGVIEEGHDAIAQQLKDAFQRDRDALLDCYSSQYSKRHDHTADYLHLNITIEPKGNVSRLWLSERSLSNKITRACIEDLMKAWTFTGATAAKKDSLLEFGLGFQQKNGWRVDFSRLEWRTTRLRARYTKDDFTEDIQFSLADEHPRGGTAAPYGANADLPLVSVEAFARSYQVRHILLHDWEGPSKCRYPVRGEWEKRPKYKAGAVSSAASKAPSKGSYKITDDIRAQLDEHYNAEQGIYPE